MSVHVLLTHKLWRQLNADHDDLFVYFKEHGIRLSYVIVDNKFMGNNRLDTLEFTNEKWEMLFRLEYGEYLEHVQMDETITRCHSP